MERIVSPIWPAHDECYAELVEGVAGVDVIESTIAALIARLED